MRCIGNIWYVPFADLTGRAGLAVTTVSDGIQRGSAGWQSIKDPDDHRRRLIRYDTLRPTYQAVVRAVLCGGMEPADWHKNQLQRGTITGQYTLAERLEAVLTGGYKRYEGLYVSDDTSRTGRKTTLCLARAAGVVELLVDYTRTIDPRSYGPYEEVIAWLNADGNYDYYFPRGNQYLPLNPVKLKEKVLERTIGRKESKKPRENRPLPLTEVIYKPRQHNKNRDEFGSDAELMAWIAISRMHGRNDTNAYIIRKIQEVCQIVGREVPSASWFSQVLSSTKMQMLTAPTRHGTDSAFAGRYTHSITMARAMYAGDCWMMDATRVNFIEHATTDDASQKRFLVVIVVRDAYSGDIVGIHFDTKEDRWGYTNALKMAVKATGYLPHTLVHDRFPGHLTDEMTQLLGAIERKGTHLVCTHKATGKALLERWFDTMQTVFLAKSRYYYGQGIRSTRAYAHRSPEYLLRLRKEANRDGFNFDQAWQEAWKCIEEYRQTPLNHYSKVHKTLNLTPQQLHSQSEKPNVIALATYEQAGLFWLTKPLDIRRGTIEHEVHGERCRYQIFDNKLLYTYQRVGVKYEESDPSSVMLFALGPDDTVSDFFIAEIKRTTDVAIYGPDADPAQLAKRQAVIKRVQDERATELETIIRGTDQDPEYLLNMGRHVDKAEYASVESGLLYDHMATVQPTPASSIRAKTKPAKPPAPNPLPASDFNVHTLLNY